jgi:hypothetical protein
MAIKVIALLSTFAGRACLAAAVAIAALTPPLAPADASNALYRLVGTNPGRDGGLSAHGAW